MTAGNDHDPPIHIIGFQWSPAAHDIKDFLARSRVRYQWLDVETSEEARRVVGEMGVRHEELPLVLFPDGASLRDPAVEELAERIGLQTEAESPFYDLIIVGGGPAGMAAAVYGASEGLRTVVIERDAPGGQAGMSSSIENFLGFPEGLSGSDLAQRAVAQVQRFGGEIVSMRQVTQLRLDDPYRVVKLDDGTEIYGHTILLAMGVSWRVLEAPGCRSLIGRGIYYGAASAEAHACRDRDVYLLGAGNSAGQAAMFLARVARSVTLVAPERDFAERMSEYLLERLQRTPNVRFRAGHKVTNAMGERALERITVQNVETGAEETLPTSTMFVFIGAQPETEWLQGVVARDEQGYLLSSEEALAAAGSQWPLQRAPYPFETSAPGVFVAGDVRLNSVKRVGAAVGEGSSVIQHIHAYLASG